MSRPPVVSPDDQSVTFVELFFDLIFVFSITQIAALFHGHLDWVTIGSAGLVFWLVWWAWTQFTWALNAANTDHTWVQFGTLAATALAFFMAVEVPNAFGDGALWFALPYIAVRSVGLVLYKWVTSHDPVQNAAVRRFALLSLTGFAAVILGAILGGSAQYWLWGSAIALDVFAAGVGANTDGFEIHPGHFVERHGLIVIVALGESLIVAAGGLTDAPRTQALVAVGFLAVAVSCGLWWSYFPYCRPALEVAMSKRNGTSRSSLARDIFSLAHFPMLCGIVAFAVGIEAAASHPEEVLALEVRLALASGFLLFVGGTGLAIWRAIGRILWTRVFLAAGIATAVAVIEGPPSVALGTMLVGVATLVVVEHRSVSRKSLLETA